MNEIPTNGQADIRISPDDVTFLTCSCGNDVFIPALKLGLLSRLHPKSQGQDQLVPAQTFVCSKCGNEFNPQN